MPDDRNTQPWLRRITEDPVRLRRRSRLGAVCSSVAAGVGYGFADGSLSELLLALTWIALPFLALGIGFGDGFYVRHGHNKRRVLLQVLVGAGVALFACVVLAQVPKKSRMWSRNMLDAIGYALLYGSVLLVLAGAATLAVTFGEAYLARRIDERGDDDW